MHVFHQFFATRDGQNVLNPFVTPHGSIHCNFLSFALGKQPGAIFLAFSPSIQLDVQKGVNFPLPTVTTVEA
jgi:hypothetical protein